MPDIRKYVKSSISGSMGGEAIGDDLEVGKVKTYASFPWRKTHEHYESYRKKAKTQQGSRDKLEEKKHRSNPISYFFRDLKCFLSKTSKRMGGFFCEYIVQPQALKLLGEGDIDAFLMYIDSVSPDIVHRRFAGYTLLHYVGLLKYSGCSSHLCQILIERGADPRAEKTFSFVPPFVYLRVIHDFVYDIREDKSLKGKRNDFTAIPDVHIYNTALWTGFLKQIVSMFTLAIVCLFPVLGWYLFYEIFLANLYETPLHTAANHFDVRLIIALCEHYRNYVGSKPLKKQIDCKRMDGLSPLHMAVRCINEDAVFSLLKYGADPLVGEKGDREEAAVNLLLNYNSFSMTERHTMTPLEYCHWLFIRDLGKKERNAVSLQKKGDIEMALEFVKSEKCFSKRNKKFIVKPSKKLMISFIKSMTGLTVTSYSSMMTIEFLLLAAVVQPDKFEAGSLGISSEQETVENSEAHLL